MENDQVIAALRLKLEDAVSREEQHSYIADIHKAKALYWNEIRKNLKATIQALSSDAFEEPIESYSQTSIYADGHQPRAEGEDKDPKSMKRPEFQKMGYIKIAERLLEGHPKGKTVDEMVHQAFSYQTPEDFERAKNSFYVELNRGVREKRLGKNPDSDVYFFPYLEVGEINLSTEVLDSPGQTPADIDFQESVEDYF
jgi:hypothetical protein